MLLVLPMLVPSTAQQRYILMRASTAMYLRSQVGRHIVVVIAAVSSLEILVPIVKIAILLLLHSLFPLRRRTPSLLEAIRMGQILKRRSLPTAFLAQMD